MLIDQQSIDQQSIMINLTTLQIDVFYSKQINIE